MRFPDLVARDLEGTRYVLPDDLPAGPRLVLLPFQRWHQLLVNGWTRGAGPIEETFGDLTVWEVPSLSRAYLISRPFIDGGMRAGIPDPYVRRHTLTAYTDLRALAAALDLPSFETVYAFLLDARGEIVWRSEGEATAEKLSALFDAVAAVHAEDDGAAED